MSEVEMAIVAMNDINAAMRRCRLNKIRYKRHPGVVVILR